MRFMTGLVYEILVTIRVLLHDHPLRTEFWSKFLVLFERVEQLLGPRYVAHDEVDPLRVTDTNRGYGIRYVPGVGNPRSPLRASGHEDAYASQ